jgi:hypothetical protein
MTNHRVDLVVREITNGKVVAFYVRDLQLPFVPTIGMQFRQGASCWLWETESSELMPKVEAVSYDLDEKVISCLFTVTSPLKSSFWTKMEGEALERAVYASYFEART